MSTHNTRGRIPALTVRQPWAWAIAHLGKNVENRTWVTSYRGPLLIHAAAGTDQYAMSLGWPTVAAKTRRLSASARAQLHSRQAIVAMADLTDICTPDRPTDTCGPWAEPGLHHWHLTYIQPLPTPVPCRGRQRLWHPDPAITHACLAQLAN